MLKQKHISNLLTFFAKKFFSKIRICGEKEAYETRRDTYLVKSV